MENYEVKILTKLPIALGEKLVQRFDAVKIKEGQESIKIVSAYVKRIKKVVKDTFFFWCYVNACVNFTSITKCKESE